MTTYDNIRRWNYQDPSFVLRFTSRVPVSGGPLAISATSPRRLVVAPEAGEKWGTAIRMHPLRAAGEETNSWRILAGKKRTHVHFLSTCYMSLHEGMSIKIINIYMCYIYMYRICITHVYILYIILYIIYTYLPVYTCIVSMHEHVPCVTRVFRKYSHPHFVWEALRQPNMTWSGASMNIPHLQMMYPLVI